MMDNYASYNDPRSPVIKEGFLKPRSVSPVPDLAAINRNVQMMENPNRQSLQSHNLQRVKLSRKTVTDFKEDRGMISHLSAGRITVSRNVDAMSRSAVSASMVPSENVKMKQHRTQLMNIFQSMDTNGDGSLTFEELKAFLDSKCTEPGGFNPELLDLLFKKIDANFDNKISSTEFVNHYLESELKIRKSHAQCVKVLADRVAKKKALEKQLQQVMREQINEYGVMANSKFQLSVLEGKVTGSQNFGQPGVDQSQFYLRVTVGQVKDQTSARQIDPERNNEQPNDGVVWAQDFSFPITSGQELVSLTLGQKDPFGLDNPDIGRVKLDLRKDFGDQLVHELWLDVGQSSILISGQWIFSEVQFCTEAIQTLKQAMNLNKEQIENLKKHLRDLRAPFKDVLGEDEGYSTEIDEELAYLDQMRNSEVGENIAQAEAKFVEQTDPVATLVGNWFGYDEGQLAPFYSKCIMIVAFIYGVLSIFSCFARPDFLNLTICTVAGHQLASVRSIRKSTFRYLVLGIAISFLYDIVWLFLDWEEFEQDRGEIESEGKVEAGMKRFSLYVSVFSVLFRPIVMALFWRVSIDFKAIMKPELM